MSAPKQPLEDGLMMAMKALDNQIAREMNRRTPAEREELGVQKWDPIGSRVERVTGLILDALGEEDVSLDSILVLSQAFTKALQMVASELGEDGLGTTRAAYCIAALEMLKRDADEGLRVLTREKDLLS